MGKNKLKIYPIKITFTSSMIIEIEATSAKQALDIAIEENSCLCADDFYGEGCDIKFRNIKY